MPCLQDGKGEMDAREMIQRRRNQDLVVRNGRRKERSCQSRREGVGRNREPSQEKRLRRKFRDDSVTVSEIGHLEVIEI